MKTSVLRFWETEFRWLRPEKSSGNQRVYTRKQVERVLEVKELLYERGFTIAGARKHLARGGGGPADGDRQLLEKVKQELRELLQLLDE